MKHISTFLAMVLLASLSLHAQLAGRLSGTVTDPTGAPVPGAAVNVYLAGGSSPVLSTTTTSEGLFSFGAVRPDAYDLEVAASGFAKFVSRAVRVDPSRDTNIPPIRLELQSAQQTVDVTAESQTVQVNNSEISTTVTQEQIQNLPVLDRQVSSLFLTQPGVSNGRGATVVNGLRTSFANVTLDGINIQDNYIRSNSLDYIPNKTTIAQVAEFTVATSNAGSAVGNGVAQMVLSTPSGSNTYHGSLYWYNRNSYFSANDWFNNKNGLPVPHLNLNQLGGTLGGHIVKDKLFFFTNYEAFRLKQQSPVTTTVLTPSARNGILTYRDRSGKVLTKDLLATRRIQVDPAITALLQQVPATINSNDVGDGLNTGGYSFNARDNEDRNVFLWKTDYYLSSKHSFTGTYSFNTDKVDRPDIGTFYTAVPPTFNDNHAHLASIAWRWTLTPTLTNELRGGFNLSPGVFNVSNAYPKYFIAGQLFTSPLNTFVKQGRDTDTYHVQDNAFYSKGKHTVYFGFQSQFIRVRPFDDGGTIPTYSLGISNNNDTGFGAAELPGISQADLNTANALYSTLGGIVSDYSQTFNVTSRTSGFVAGAPNIRHLKYDNYAGYVQDNWRVHPRLTLNLGLRYEIQTPLDERDSLVLLPKLINGNPINTLLSNATLDFAGSSVGRPYYNFDKNNFAPNFGFAYDPFGNGKTAIRGGYSISYVNDDTITAVSNNITTNSGLASSVTNDEGLVGRLTGALPAIPVPTFKVPLTDADNYANNTANAVGLPDPNLRTPYVQQYSFGIQHEIKSTVFEVRYVGNHATKELRAFDFNQVVIRENGFLDDFNRARSNGFLALAANNVFDPRYNAKIAGSQPLTVFPKIVNNGFLTNSSVLRYIRQGEAGQLGAFYQSNSVNGDVNFFRNPNALGTNYITNFSNSTYNSLQLDVRHRTVRGIQFQGNYTFSKVLSDSAGDGSARFEPFMDINTPSAERAPAPFDLRHVIKGNYVIPLPFGSGRHFQGGRVMNAVFGGWGTSGIVTYQSGTPYSVLSARGTVNRTGTRAASNTVISTVSGDQLNNLFGLFKTGNGVYFINPGAIGPDGRGAVSDGLTPFNGQVFLNPQPGTLGPLQRRMFNGPWSFDWDVSVGKTFQITERQSVQFRADAFNVTNHPSFYPGGDGSNHNINSSTFGKITTTQYSSRLMQFGLYYRF